ncbi:MAG: hypothetical protein M3O80_05240 [Chloroflexota bacterium]|nr:hypothetical protein [Chloroflexota bacterium]
MTERDDESEVRDILGREIDGLTPPPLVFVPEVGFRPTPGGLRLLAPTTVERDGRTLKVDHLVSTERGAELRFDLVGIDPPDFREPSSVRELLRDTEGRSFETGRSWLSTMGIERGIRRTASFETLPVNLRKVELVVTHGHVVSSAWLDLIPLESSGLSVREPTDLSDTRHGITIRVRGIASGETSTALDLAVTAVAPVRFVRGIGAFMGIRRGPTKLKLQDEQGRIYEELDPTLPPRGDPSGQTDVAVFPPLPPDAHSIELVVNYVIVEESEGEVDVTLPVTAPRTLDFGRYPIRVVGSRVVGPPPARSTPPGIVFGDQLRLDLDLGGWQNDRRLLYPGRVFADGTDHGFRWSPKFPPTETNPTNAAQIEFIEVNVTDPSSVKTVRLTYPTVHVRGPWRIRLERS